MVKVAFIVPFWFVKLMAQLKGKEAALQAAKENKEDVENRVEFEVQDIYFKISAYKDIVLLYETALIPQAQQAFDASQTGFETGAISFLDWLDTERTYLQTRLAYYKSITDYHKAVAHLERIVGGNLEGVQDEK
jgi:cobalt-zinc-cadmium efflux system outer membrane protein